MTVQKKLTSTGPKAALVAATAIALLAAGCTSADPVSRNAITSTSSGAGSSGGGTGEVPATAYLSVVENYFADAAVVGPSGSQPLRFAVTDRRTIARLAALINALPTAPDQNIIAPCPSSLAPAYRLDFQDAKNTAPVAEVSIECFGVMVTVHGHDEPILSDSAPPGAASFLRTVGLLLSGSMPRAN